MTSSPPPPALSTRLGKLTLALLCTIAFLDFVDASIVNVALPSIRDDLDFSVQSLQWVLSGYLLTYGGFMLLGGRAADLFGRRRVLVTGTTVFALSSLAGGLAQSSGMLVGARLAQGVGAAMMLPAALSLLTTTFTGTDRHKALGVWGGVAGLASAVGVLLGGVLSEGPGWRWVLLVNEPVCVAAIVCVFLLFADDRKTPDLRRLDLRGALLSTTGMLLLVYTLIKAPDVGWGAGRTIAGLAGAAALLVVFVLNEARSDNPLLPLSIFRIRGLAAADVTQLIGIAGIIAMFFFLTLYMQNVLGYSQIKTGLSYLPLCFGVGIAAGIASSLLAAVGTKPVMVGGALLASGGVFWLSRVPVDGTFLADLLPGMMLAAFGLGFVFVSVTTAANEGVPAAPGRAGRVSAQRLPAGRRRARAGDLLRAGDRADQGPAGRARPAARGADRRLPARAAGLLDLPGGGRAVRAADGQLARRGARGGRGRGGRGRRGATAPGRARPGLGALVQDRVLDGVEVGLARDHRAGAHQRRLRVLEPVAGQHAHDPRDALGRAVLQEAGDARGARRLAEDALDRREELVGVEDLLVGHGAHHAVRGRHRRHRLLPARRVADADRAGDRLGVLDHAALDQRRGARGLEAEHARRPAHLLEALPVGSDVAGVADRDAQRVDRWVGPNSSTISNDAVFWPSIRNGLTLLTSAIGWRSQTSRTSLSATSKLPRSAITRAPCISAWASLPVAILPSGTITAPRSPARAA